MQKTIQLQLLPSEAASDAAIREYAAASIGCPIGDITGFNLLRRSIDARSAQPHIIISVEVFVREPFHQQKLTTVQFRDVAKAPHSVIVVGAGPAGLFAALRLIEKGIRPIVLERGKDVRSRRRDLAQLNKEGIINPDSNYCFGEGGAGTYSDGKLYTRSNKRGDIHSVLSLLVQFGADPSILIDAHPHIGTNKLPQIIQAMRQQITDSGGLFLFEKKIVELVLQNEQVKHLITADGDKFEADAIILATGHSARDIFHLLYNKDILIEAKPFALGVRIEHPQHLIDQLQYRAMRSRNTPIGALPTTIGHPSSKSGNRSASIAISRPDFLPPASYSLVQQVDHGGVFSFCMCPGGIIAPASTADNELVVNGWSPSKRNNPFANSGIVVSVEEKDLKPFSKHGPLAALYFQQSVEQKAYAAGGGKFVAPAQRMSDLVAKRASSTLPDCSYNPGLRSVPMQDVLPGFIFESLRQAFPLFDKKMRGYLTNEAVIVATESRTSSPVRIPRHPQTLQHPQIHNLYPCGEGAGYAGGIVSAAMDGQRVAETISLTFGHL